MQYSRSSENKIRQADPKSHLFKAKAAQTQTSRDLWSSSQTSLIYHTGRTIIVNVTIGIQKSVVH